MLQIIHHHLSPQETPITGLNDCRPVEIIYVIKKNFVHVVGTHLNIITAHGRDPLQLLIKLTDLWGMHSIILQLDWAGTYAMILLVDFSSAFKASAPNLLRSMFLV